MRALVTGGAGFVGSHLCEALILRGYEVWAVDDLTSGRKENLASGVTFIERDVAYHDLDDLGPVDLVAHLACPASPADYLARPLETLRTCADGTRHAAELALLHDARFLMTSTSEVYGDPAVHPQPEGYWGNVNPTGERAVYDEGKRYAEALVMAMYRKHGLRLRLARLFNSYGPRLRSGDGRVVSNFIVAALRGAPLTVYGDGAQTRSLCFVDDTVAGLVALALSENVGPVNIGNPDERRVIDLARLIIELVGSKSVLEYRRLPSDDPARRCPDIGLARRQLGWEPQVSVEDGLLRTISWFRAFGLY